MSANVYADAYAVRTAFGARVVHGSKRGRLLGYRTANLDAAPPNCKAGVYAGFARVLDDDERYHLAVASLTQMPPSDGGAQRLEVHLVDRASECEFYDKTLEGRLCVYLRPLHAYADDAQLSAAIAADVEFARRIVPLDEAHALLSIE